MIHFIATYKVKEEKLEEVKNAIPDFVTAVRDNEPTTLYYSSYQKKEEPLSFVHLMSFENEDAKRFHENAEYTKKFMEFLCPECENPPEYIELQMIKCNKNL
ncbi:putative quinol monooxygenase [candidate division KSB1 bacterium]